MLYFWGVFNIWENDGRVWDDAIDFVNIYQQIFK